MKAISHTITIFSALLLLASASHAAGGGHEGDPRGGGPREACREDARTFCKDVQPGGGRIKDCLEDHYQDISGSCYNALQKAEARRSENNGDAPPSPPPQE